MAASYHPVAQAESAPVTLHKGRGAVSRLAHRFAADAREVFDDGWAQGVADSRPESALRTGDEDLACIATDEVALPRNPQTHVHAEQAKSVITKNDSPDIPLSLGLNPYRGCEHGCIYCYARPTHSYLNLSPGLDFETHIVAKTNAADVLRRDLMKKSHVVQPIMLGSATDAYQPAERRARITRGVLQLLHDCRHPVGLVTKSALVERDIDLLAPMAAQQLVGVYFSIATLDGEVARRLEPRAASPARRLRAMHTLAQAGIPVGVSLSPQIPFITQDMEQVLKAAWDAGARHAFYGVVRLPWEVAPLFIQWVQTHYPDRAQRVLSSIAQLRGGKAWGQQGANDKLYDSAFGRRMTGVGLWADLYKQRFTVAARKLGFNQSRLALRTDLFVPPRTTDGLVATNAQGELF